MTNPTRRTRTFSARVLGPGGLRVSVASLTLTPGETADVTLRLVGPLRAGDAGAVEWRDAHGAPVVRWSVVVAR